jgi:FAD synthase
MALANAYLGYDYFLTGTVLKENNWDELLDSTANIKNKRRLQADST